MVDGDSLKLSTFGRWSRLLFCRQTRRSRLAQQWTFFAGATFNQPWSAVKTKKQAADEFGIARLKDTAKRHLSFSFRSIDGKMVSLSDPAFKNKVVVIQIMGSWCPNCMDETAFLSQYYKMNKSRGVEFIALAYERTTDFETSRKSLESFRKRFNIAYPVLVTGVTVSDSLLTEKHFPLLTR